MTEPDRWRRIRDLFERAIDQPPAAVAEWLHQETLGDPEIRAEVASLLDHHSRAGSFLIEPVANRLPELMTADRVLEPGQTIGPYVVVREVGRGGMGRVYLATDNRLQRHVALKALSPMLTGNSASRDRLRREAQAAAALTHPGISTIYALEEIDGELYIAAEFIEGHTLREEIDTARLPGASEMLRTARELAAALAHAHGRGIVHRDLKPENVMRTRDGGIKILDFGLARTDALAADPDGHGHLTASGAIVGTPAYMAPEQVSGGEVTASADVFAFGVVLYEYASGMHPFAAPNSLAMTARILEASAAPLGSRRPDLPSQLLDAVERCLQKAPEDRFRSAVDVAVALNRPDVLRPARRMTKWWRTHQLATVALYFVACGMMWQVKEWLPGVATALFVLAGIVATIGGMFRGHLVFTEWANGPGLDAERRRAAPVTMATDLLLAGALAIDGLMLVPAGPLPAVLTFALAVGLALARLLVEPSTTSASFRA